MTRLFGEEGTNIHLLVLCGHVVSEQEYLILPNGFVEMERNNFFKVGLGILVYIRQLGSTKIV